MPEINDTRCSFIKPNGERCGGRSVSGGTLCFTHSPSHARARDAARRRGGRARARQAVVLAGAPDLPLKTAGDVTAALALTFNDVRTGRVDARVGNCLSLLGSALLRALEGTALEERLARIEQHIAAQPAAANGRPYR